MWAYLWHIEDETTFACDAGMVVYEHQSDVEGTITIQRRREGENTPMPLGQIGAERTWHTVQGKAEATCSATPRSHSCSIPVLRT